MHGTVSFTSQVGLGATFFVDLPDRSPSNQHSTAAAAGSARTGKAERVLLCEDDPELALSMKTHLASEGFDVHVVSSASQAREALAQGGYAAMTLDFELPDEDGLSFFRSLREMTGTAASRSWSFRRWPMRGRPNMGPTPSG
jgi:PleD family two-component response regulator